MIFFFMLSVWSQVVQVVRLPGCVKTWKKKKLALVDLERKERE